MTLFIENAITWASKKKTDIVVGCHFNFFKSEKFRVEVFLPNELDSREHVSVYLINAEECRTIDETKKQSMLESNERIQNKNAVRKKNYLITKASFIQNSYGKQSNAEILFKIG